MNFLKPQFQAPEIDQPTVDATPDATPAQNRDLGATALIFIEPTIIDASNNDDNDVAEPKKMNRGARKRDLLRREANGEAPVSPIPVAPRRVIRLQ